MNLKNLPVIVLALVLTLAFANVAVAESATTYYTITGPADGHEYAVYQIFTGDQSGDTLSNVKWGLNGTGTVGEDVPEHILNALQELTDNTQATADAIAEYVDFSSTSVAFLTDSDSTVSLPVGYYLVKDNGSDTGDAYSTHIVFVAKAVTLNPKRDEPTLEKKVMDINDSTSVKSDWQDSADYDLYDSVPFKLTGTVASNYDSYKTYKYSFEDDLSDCMNVNLDSVVVKIDGETVSADQYTLTPYNNRHEFTLSFADLKKVTPVASANSEITVEYTAFLNNNILSWGDEGAVNKARLHYSNNPNNSDGGDDDDQGETPWDSVIVFTYYLVVNKVDSEQKPLTGAWFRLYKVLEDGTRVKLFTIDMNNETRFGFQGLDDGIYVLEESTTPTGYNSIDPITFKVTAEHNDTWDGSESTRKTVLTDLSGNKIEGEITLTGSKSECVVSTDIVNNKGVELPTTGGIGVTIFYVAGAIAVLGAALVAVSKKRMSSET